MYIIVYLKYYVFIKVSVKMYFMFMKLSLKYIIVDIQYEGMAKGGGGCVNYGERNECR